MKALFRLLVVLTIVGLNLAWLVPGDMSSADTYGSYDIVDDYWPMDLTGDGELIHAVHDVEHGTMTWYYATASPTGALAGAVNDTAIGNLSWGREVDRKYVLCWRGGYGVWDLGEPYQEVVVFPVMRKAELWNAFEYDVYGCNEFDPTKPWRGWQLAYRVRFYRQGWSSVGQDLFEVCNDDYVSVWRWPSAVAGTSGYRYVKVQVNDGPNSCHIQIDAVKGVRAAPPVAEAECGGWETSVVEKGRTFNYTSLEIGEDGRTHIAYGGEQLLYAVRDGTSWRIDEVDWGGVGAYCSLALDSSGYPAISYYDAVNGDLKYARQNWWLNAVWGASSTDVYAVGDGGVILHYDGVVWKPMASPTSQTLRAVWGSSWNNIVAVGDGGTIVRYNGSSWINVSSGTVSNLGSVWGTPNGSGGFDVFAVGDAFAVGGTYYYGLLRSTCDGSVWTAWTQPWMVAHGTSGRNLRGVWASTPSNVFAVGDAGTVIRYDGVSWSSMTSGTSATLRGIWGSGGDYGAGDRVYVVGDAVNGVTAIRQFNGSVWASMSSGHSDCLNSVWGTSTSDVFAVGCRGAILHYNGSSWLSMASNTTNPLHGAWGSSPTNVFAVGFRGTIAEYDGTIWIPMAVGNGWLKETVDSLDNVGLHTSLEFDGDDRPCISYYDATNGDLNYARWNGSRWDLKVVDSIGWVGEYTSLAFDGLGYPAISYYDATNEDLRLARWDGSCWVTPYPGVVDGAGLVDSAGDVGSYSSLAFADTSGYPAVSYHDATVGSLKYARWNGSAWDIWMVDDQGWTGQYTSLDFDTMDRPAISYFDATEHDLRFARWSGLEWRVVVVDKVGNVGSHTSLEFDRWGGLAISYYDATNDALKVACRSSDRDLSAIWGAESLSPIFAVGEQGIIRRFNGKTWPAVDSAESVHLNDVWGASSTRFYAVGDAGTILFYDGTGWSPLPSGTGVSLRGIWGTSTTDIFAVGDGGTILHYDGSSWTPMASGTTWTLRAVWGTSSTNVIAVGDCGTILRYDGSSWTARTSGVTQCLNSVWGDFCSGIYVVGCDGIILRSNDCAGVTWTKMTSGTTRGLSGVWGTTNSDVIAVGEWGTILHFNGVKWSAVSSGTTEWLRGIWGNSPSNVLVVGDGGTILRYNGSLWSLMWEIETVDPYPWAGRFSSLVFDDDGNPAVSFYDAREGSLKFARWDRYYWAVETVDSYGDVGRYTSLAFDGDGNPAISYYEVSRGNLKYAQWNGASWDISTVESANDVGWYSSLAFDAAGNPGISHYNATNGDLRFCYRDGETWSGTLVDATGDVGSYSSLGFDLAGNAGIGYYDKTNGNLKYAAWNGSAWNIDVVDWIGDVGSHCSLEFDCGGNPAVSYFDATNGDLKYAHRLGGDWAAQVVDEEGRVGLYTSLAFDYAKHPAISYHDASNGALKLARWDGAKWALETVDGTQTSGHHTSLALSRCGTAAISYGSPMNGDLRYAFPANSPPNQPANKLPVDGAIYVDLTPTLECKAFADPCVPDTCPRAYFHRASQWLITAEDCEIYCGVVFDSGVDSSNLLSIEIPPDVLQPNTTYYWSVRHQDCHGAWSKYSDRTVFTTGSPPDTPVNESPADGATRTSVAPTLAASAFSDPETGDIHVASQWQMSLVMGDYSTPILDEKTERVNLTRIELPDGILENRTTYYWRVRYQDNHGTWSEFSEETSFETNNAPDQPVNQEPADGEGKVSRKATLVGSEFADADEDEEHRASRWRVITRVEDKWTVVFDSGEDTSNLTEITLPGGTLEYDTSYHWQVKYQDSQGSWSSWSAETGFSTGGQPTVPTALLVAAAAVAVIAVVAMTAPLVVPL